MTKRIEVEIRSGIGGGRWACLLSPDPGAIALWEHCLPHHDSRAIHPAWTHHSSLYSVSDVRFRSTVEPLLRAHGYCVEVLECKDESDG